MKLLIIANFHVRIAAEPGQPDKIAYGKGMVVDDGNLPFGQSADDWIDKGLAARPKSEIAAGAPPR